jgi:hypothetical protein
MSDSALIAHVDTGKITRQELALLPTPPSTPTHQVIPHVEIVNAIIESLGFRHIAVHRDEYAVSKDGNKMFGLMELDQTFAGCLFALGLRNSHDKTMRLALTVGYRMFICDNMAFNGDFQPLLAKHTKNFRLTKAISAGIDDMQRNFEPMVKAVEAWRESQISDVTAKLIIYRAFVEGALDAPRHLDRRVNELYFNPAHEDFALRTMWSLSNAFTSALKELAPVSQFWATGRRMKRQARFQLGQLAITRGSLEAFTRAGDDPLRFLARHAVGDWGEIDEEDRRENERSLAAGCRILSAYRLTDGTRIWIITEADRSATTILLPGEY